MKVRMTHMLTADNILLDNLTNKVSLIGLFNQINIPADKDSIVVRFGVTAQLVFDELPDEDVNVELCIIKPSGDVEKTAKMAFGKDQFPDSGEAPITVPLIVNFSAVEFAEIGTYNIKVAVNGEPPIVSPVSFLEAKKMPPKEVPAL